ncbi:hypothetical protein V495_04422 [Pseudogymnoascus sp. VKM F-4514 (FW-929)]|nr:hypothetical protein V495_04422 [Pseudogymnoascus sp. VKM F-4514 (FW-929)]
MDSTTPVLAPGQSPPLAVISPTNQGGVVLIITALCMVFALVSILIRLYIRLQIRHAYERDDSAVAIAMLFSIIQSSVVFVEVSKGYGKTIRDISPSGIIELQKASYASDILYIVSLWLTKFSVAFLLFRLSSDKRHNWMSRAILLTAAILAAISVFIVALRCDLSQPWIFINEQCTNLLTRWKVVLAFDILTELALVGNSVYLVRDLHVPLGKKIVVVLAFALRLPIIAPAALRLYYLDIQLSSSDPTLSGTLASVCAQIEISYAIISATIPCLRPFMSSLNTHYGAPHSRLPLVPHLHPSIRRHLRRRRSSPRLDRHPRLLSRPPQLPGSGGSKSNPPTPLESLSKEGRPLGTKKRATLGEMWDKPGNLTRVTRGEKHSIDSHDSKQMIITMDTEWAVEFEGQSGTQTPRTADRPVADA